ncbi:ABC transporter permease [candidate division KSB1 bacterium]|nr:ABC transporter permease [candidate division KSB1 bacterium]
MGHFLDTLREIFHYLRQYKSRTFMTMFGIVWGTMTVIILLAFGVGLKRFLSKSMHGIGEQIVILWPGRTSIPYQGYGRDRNIRFREEDAEYLRHEVIQIKSISPEYSRWGTPIRLGDKINRPNITGIIPEYGPMRNIWPQPGGRWLNEVDIKNRRRVVFLGDKLKDFLFGEETNAIGKYVCLGEIPFLVVGVLKKKTQNSSYNSRDQDRAFIPSTTFSSIFGNRYISNIIYQVKDARVSEAVQKEVYRAFAKKFKFDPTDKETLWIWDTTEMDKFVFYFALGFNLFMGLIGIITLVVGGIGLANIMYVVVQERTKEIGIRRSIGAKSRHILGQFVLESFIIIGMSAALGFLFAYGLIKLISMFPIEDYVGIPVLSIPVALVTIFILAIVGFLAGFFPSRRAAKLVIVDCLRG